jgi:hypothetical protein
MARVGGGNSRSSPGPAATRIDTPCGGALV